MPMYLHLNNFYYNTILYDTLLDIVQWQMHVKDNGNIKAPR